MELSFLKRYDSIKRLIDFGSNGYFPLFESEITNQSFKDIKMNKADRLKAKSLLKKISGHNCLEKQKVLFSTFTDSDRALVLKAFLELIEGRILDANPQLQ